jgi:hypothetical protein
MRRASSMRRPMQGRERMPAITSHSHHPPMATSMPIETSISTPPGGRLPCQVPKSPNSPSSHYPLSSKRLLQPLLVATA